MFNYKRYLFPCFACLLFFLFWLPHVLPAQWIPQSSPSGKTISSVDYDQPGVDFAGTFTYLWESAWPYKTTDGGVSWVPMPAYPLDSVYVRSVIALDFSSPDEGAILVQATDTTMVFPLQAYELRQTMNQGQSWQELTLPAVSILSGFMQRTPDSLWIYGSEALFRTTDGGATWQSSPMINRAGFDLEFPGDSAVGYVGGFQVVAASSYAWLAKTTDHGQTWTSIDLSAYNMTLIRIISFIDADVGFVAGDMVGGGARLLQTTDGGQTWAQVTAGPGLGEDLVFVHLGRSYWQTAGDIYESTDGGQTWNFVLGHPNGQNFTGLHNASAFVYAYGDSGAIYQRALLLNQEEPEAPATVRVFPNPCADFLSVELPEAGNYELRLTDVQGREVRRQGVVGKTADMKVRDLPAGTYWLGIAPDGGRVTQWSQVRLVK